MNIAIKIRISLLILLLSSSLITAQNLELSGQLVDPNNQPVAFATTYLYKVQDSTLVKATISDDNGYFVIKELQSDRYYIALNSLGFAPYESEAFTLTENLKLPTITLKEAAEALDEVTIIAEKPIVEVLADKTVFNVDKTINATGSTGFELLRKAPGVLIDNNNSIIVEGKAGVQIYIDGRPSVLAGQDLINYLETLQSTDIESIEIITQPSSKYEAAGNAGIINIILKRNKSLGTNGSLTLGYIQGKFPRVNSSINLNNRGKKTNLYGTYSNRFGDGFGFIDLFRRQNGTTFDQRSTTVLDINNHNIKTGFDYYINDKHTLGALFNANFSNVINRTNSRTPIIPGGETTPVEVLIAQSNSDNVSSNLNGNLNYKYKDTIGREFTVDLNYGNFYSDRNNFQPNFYLNGAEEDTLSESIARFITPIQIDIIAGQVDYEQPLMSGKLAAGIRYSYVKTNNVFDFFDVVDGQEILNLEQTNTFDYTEQINAAYLNYNIRWDKWNLQLGLRVEQTISEGDLTSAQDNANDLVERNYTDWFPSGGLTYQLNRKNSLALTYSRRIQRPTYQSLNPFQFKIDELTFRQGNPFLQPQYTNNIKLSHTYNYRLTTSFTYTYISDFFAQVTEALGEDQNFINQRNVANQRVYNLGVSYPTRINDWWSIYFSINAFRSEYEATSEDFLAVSQNTLSFYGQNTFKLPADFTFEVSGWFQSPSIWGGTYQTQSLGSLDVALQKKFFNDKLTLRLAGSDILFTSPWQGVTEFGDLIIDGSGGSDSRQFRMSLNYNFGSDEVKKARKRKTAIEDESGRIEN
ncbi:TonB-dependent receptor domain-containing protein [Gilvibacter sediminis]|uniref:TonB-dependent receptor domain-containing protein n=1 Tax=Gilvibacter sediminis TaxID=379071 RepID=UPI00234FDBFD|nr:TonB-dependent receptor [Gilvibacter sediminis]MDC7999007.1 TonB-dependent receptor [Gilvibacter sediminis]